MAILQVEGLCKKYEKFTLNNVSLTLEEGYIMGFVGVNGAGKTTTLKSMLGLVHPDAGKVSMFGMDFAQNEFACKQKIGFMLGEAGYYPHKKLKTVADVVRGFYEEWDEKAFRGYMDRFSLDADKKIDQLSAGMRVKFQLALALSHNARLLILDEPTSGLDPVSRDDLLELFQQLIEDGTRSILFSTHIITDLEKCADYITYIHAGRVLASRDLASFVDSWRIAKGPQESLTEELREKCIGVKKNAFGFSALMRTEDADSAKGVEIGKADLESIMIHREKEA